MRSRLAARTISLLTVVCALGGTGCQIMHPAAWGPTKTNRGWNTVAGDSMGAVITQPRMGTVATAKPAMGKSQMATVRTEP